MRVLFVTRAMDNPSTRYRALPLAALIMERGGEARFLAEEGAGVLLSRYDVVFVQRRLLAAPLVPLLKMIGRYLVFDFDDAIFLRSGAERYDMLVFRSMTQTAIHELTEAMISIKAQN